MCGEHTSSNTLIYKSVFNEQKSTNKFLLKI